jgi:hypothetical protein
MVVATRKSAKNTPNTLPDNNRPNNNNNNKKRKHGSDAVPETNIPKGQTNDGALETLLSFPKNIPARNIVVSNIENQKALSDYAKKCVRIHLGLWCKLMDEPAEDQTQLLPKAYDLLDDADVYRGFYLLDRITFPPQAIAYLEGFWKHSHKSVKDQLGFRFVKEIEKERVQDVYGPEWEVYPEEKSQPDRLESWIGESRSNGKDVRYHSSEELQMVNDQFPNMIRAMREGDGKPLTYNVKLLLTRVWELAFDVFGESSATNTTSPEVLEDRKHDLLRAAVEKDFHSRLYAAQDSVYLGEKASFIHQWCTTSPTFSEHQKLLLSMAETREASLPAVHASQKRSRHGDGPHAPRRESVTTAQPIDMDEVPTHVDEVQTDNSTGTTTDYPKEIFDGISKSIHQLTPKAFRWISKDKNSDGSANGQTAKKINNLVDVVHNMAMQKEYHKKKELSDLIMHWQDLPQEIGNNRSVLLANLWNGLGKILFLHEVAKQGMITSVDKTELLVVREELGILNKEWQE